MCGRFAAYNAYPKLARRLSVVVAEDGPPPRYNIPPGTCMTGFRQVAHNVPPEYLELWLAPDLTDRETLCQVVRHLDVSRIEHRAGP